MELDFNHKHWGISIRKVFNSVRFSKLFEFLTFFLPGFDSLDSNKNFYINYHHRFLPDLGRKEMDLLFVTILLP